MFFACTTILVSPAPLASSKAHEAGACASEFSLRVQHDARSDERLRFRIRGKRRQGQRLFIPPESFGRMTPDHPEKMQSPSDVGRFGWTTALNEPGQGTAMALEIVTHAIQPFGLCVSDQPFGGERGFAGAVARQPLQCVVTLACRCELERRIRPDGFEHLVQRARRH
jgi:hypothetical protein